MTFVVDKSKIQECKDIVNESKLDFLEFDFPQKKDLDYDFCSLIFSTKNNTYAKDITIDEFYTYLRKMESLDEVTNIRWRVYNDSNKQLYYYTYNDDKENLEINLY